MDVHAICIYAMCSVPKFPTCVLYGDVTYMEDCSIKVELEDVVETISADDSIGVSLGGLAGGIS